MSIHKLICVLVQLLQHNLLLGWKTFFSFVFYANWVVFQTQSFYSGFVLGSWNLLTQMNHFSFLFFYSHLIFVIFILFIYVPLQIIIFHLCVSKGKIPEDAVHWGCLIVFAFVWLVTTLWAPSLFASSCLFDSFLDWNMFPSMFCVLFNGKSGAFIAWHVHTRSLILTNIHTVHLSLGF